MPHINIQSLDDPLLEPYRDIRNRNWTELSGRFIAEGPLLVRVLADSSYAIHSVLLDRKYQQHYADWIAPETDLLLVEHALVEQLVGFNFHRGVLACGLRKPLLSVREDFKPSDHTGETVACAVGVQDPENLGGILRNCAGLGIRRVIIGPGTADPLSRRVLRVSMGTALHLQLFRSRNLLDDLQWLHSERQVRSVATTLAEDSQSLEQSTRFGTTMILVGNERYGLPPEIQAAASQRVRIEMELATDSLNVCVAAGIVMHYFCRLAPHSSG